MFAQPTLRDVVVLPRDTQSDFVRRTLHAVNSTARLAPDAALAALPAGAPDAAAFERLVPVQDGEIPTERSVVVLDRSWHDFPAGTALYRRRSLLGDVVVGVRPMAAAPALANSRALALAGPRQDEIFGSVMTGSLTFAQFAGFALGGPEGLALAGGAAILEQIFNMLGRKQPVPTAQLIIDAVKRIGISAELEKALASFKTTYLWFTEYYERDWQDDPDVDPEEEREFKANLSAVLGPNSQFLLYVNLLEGSNYATDGFSVHMLAASFHLVLLKIDLLLKSSHKKMADVHAMTPLLSFHLQYIGSATDSMTRIGEILTTRLAKITAVKSSSSRWEFVDQAETAENANGIVYSYDSEDDADMMRDMHVTNVTALHDNHYYNGRPDLATETIAAWQKNHDDLAALKKQAEAQA